MGKELDCWVAEGTATKYVGGTLVSYDLKTRLYFDSFTSLLVGREDIQDYKMLWIFGGEIGLGQEQISWVLKDTNAFLQPWYVATLVQFWYVGSMVSLLGLIGLFIYASRKLSTAKTSIPSKAMEQS